MNNRAGKLRRIRRAILERSPSQWYAAVANRAYSQWARMFREGQWGTPLDPRMRERRDLLIRDLIARVEDGESLDSLLSGFDATQFDERVVEYVATAQWLLERALGDDLLDVGCVMNNPVIGSLLRHTCRNVWLANVALEPVSISNPVFYHLSALQQAFPRGPQFSTITCLSTIEHIGFDNRQYGRALPARFSSPTSEPFVESMLKLGTLLSDGGRLLVSVPFGLAEVVYHHQTGRAAMQVFDCAGIEYGATALRERGMAVEVVVWTATPEGWVRTAAATCASRYADGVPAAAAVALLYVKNSVAAL